MQCNPGWWSRQWENIHHQHVCWQHHCSDLRSQWNMLLCGLYNKNQRIGLQHPWHPWHWCTRTLLWSCHWAHWEPAGWCEFTHLLPMGKNHRRCHCYLSALFAEAKEGSGGYHDYRPWAQGFHGVLVDKKREDLLWVLHVIQRPCLCDDIARQRDRVCLPVQGLSGHCEKLVNHSLFEGWTENSKFLHCSCFPHVNIVPRGHIGTRKALLLQIILSELIPLLACSLVF